MSGSLDAARAELVARQGAGARYDAPDAPAGELALARRGTAFFARLLNDMIPADLDGPCRIPGWSRRHLVAHVAYNARAFANFSGAIRKGQAAMLYPSAAVRETEIARGATLPDRALRHLFHHAEVHLNVEWRDLTDDMWTRSGCDLAGQPLAVAETPWLRARELWVHALDLDRGARVRDLPGEVLSRLAAENGVPKEACRQTLLAGRRALGQAGDGMPQDWPY